MTWRSNSCLTARKVSGWNDRIAERPTVTCATWSAPHDLHRPGQGDRDLRRRGWPVDLRAGIARGVQDPLGGVAARGLGCKVRLQLHLDGPAGHSVARGH